MTRNKILIAVNYHHINSENKYSRGIYPVSPKRFNNQLDELSRDFNFISENDLLNAISKNKFFSKNCCLITFDDGLRCQYENAIPVLIKKNIPAIFFINTLPLEQNKACSVHKIHFLLSQIAIDSFLEKVEYYYHDIIGGNLELDNINGKRGGVQNIYDDDKNFKLKYLLNTHLKSDLSNKIVDKIFRLYCDDEKEFCRTLYMDKEQLLEIKKHKLFSIGLHTSSHINMLMSDAKTVKKDIIDNHDYLKQELLVNCNGISYPRGDINENDFNKKIKKTVNFLNLKYGFTMRRKANYDFKYPFLLNRFDTNDVAGGKRPIFKL